MNSYERFRAFSARESIDRPLRDAQFSPNLKKRLADAIGTDDFMSYFDMDDPGRIWPKEPPGYEPPDFSVFYKDIDLGEIAWIDEIGVARKRGSMFHFTERISPLRNATRLSELADYPIVDYTDWDESQMAREVEKFHRQGRFASVHVGHIYEFAWQVRGYEPFLVDMMERPEWCEVMLDKFVARNMKLCCAGARAGVDILYCGDDVANQHTLMFSLKHWRRFMKSRWAEVWAAARNINPSVQVFYHSDGNIESIIDELIEIGVTVLNPLQPECMDLNRIAKNYEGRLLFDGGIGTQSVFPFGRPDDVRACVKERVRQFDQGIILSPTHLLEPEVPVENVKAFFEACDEVRFGR